MSEKNEQELSKDEALKNTAESAMASKDAIKPAPADSIQFSVIFDDADGLDLEGADDADDNASGDIYSIMASAESWRQRRIGRTRSAGGQGHRTDHDARLAHRSRARGRRRG